MRQQWIHLSIGFTLLIFAIVAWVIALWLLLILTDQYIELLRRIVEIAGLS
jgi:hypothetical protein